MVEPTHVWSVHPDMGSDATCLFGLDGLTVERVEEDHTGGRLVHLVTADETATACPTCGVFSTSMKGRVSSQPRDLPYRATPVRLIWRKRRWRCGESAYERQSSTESVPAVPARVRLTGRFRTDPPQREIRAHLEAFYGHAAASTAPEVHRLAATVETWWPAIEAGLHTDYSNARSESYNRLAKYQGRDAFGFHTRPTSAAGYGGLHPPEHRRATTAITTLPG